MIPIAGLDFNQKTKQNIITEPRSSKKKNNNNREREI